jgi:hypothetical protein
MKKILLLMVFVWVALAGVGAATYYWVGGASGSWVAASFSSGSGGTGGAGVPTTGDDVYFDSNSGTNISVALTAATTIANLNVSTGGTITFTAAFTLTMSNSLTFSNGTKLSASPSSNGFGFSMGSGSAFTLTGCDANNYFRGNANGYFIINTTSTGLTLFFDPDNSVGYGAINAAKGIATIGSSVNTQRITFGSNSNNFNQGLVLAPNVTLTISGNGSCTFNQTTNCQGVDASALGSKIVITSQNTSILSTTSGNKVFKPNTTINHLEFNRSSLSFVLPQPITVTNLVMTLGEINNFTNNITLTDGGTIARTAGTLTASLTSYGTSPNVVYNGTADLTTSYELPGSVASLTVNTPTKTITLDGANTTITNALYLTAGTLSFSDTKTLTFDGGLNNVEIYRTAGQISRSSGTSTPIFNSNINLTYNGSTLITTGFEWPFSGVRLTNFTLNNNAGITMGASRTINGVLQLTAGTLNTSDKTLTLKGSISGTGTINTSTTGTLVFAGSSVQNLSAANLTGGSVNVLTVNPGVKLTTAGNITTTTLNLQSNASNGTATLVDGGVLTATTSNVEQYLSSARNFYISAPVTGATAAAGPQYWKYVEAGNNGSTWTVVNSGTGFDLGTGYVLRPTGASTYTFTGAINTGNKTITGLTSTATAKVGFNLVGNPYPSYVRWSEIAKTNVSNTMWYRTHDGTAWRFWTYNTVDGRGGISVPATVTDYIPPMQAFWVKVDAGQTGELSFDNSKRYHQDVAGNAFRAPAQESPWHSFLRLQLSNAELTDEAVIYMHENASDGPDRYDSEKMFSGNAQMPEIYTLAGNNSLVINGLAIAAGEKTLPLGINAAVAGTYTLRAGELKITGAETAVFLKDKHTGNEIMLEEGAAMQFSTTEALSGTSRFELSFRAPSSTTSVDQQEFAKLRVFSPEAGRIFVRNAPAASTLVVLNLSGQRVYDQTLNVSEQLLNKEFGSGVYLIQITSEGKTNTTKMIIR